MCVCVVPVFVLVCVRGLGDPSAGSRCSGRLRVLHCLVRAGLLSLACCLSCLLFCLICDSQPLACDDRFSPSQTLPLALCSLGRPWGNLWPGSGVLIVDCGVPRSLAHRVDASINSCALLFLFHFCFSVMALLLFTAHAQHDPVSCGAGLGWSIHGRLGTAAVRCLVFCSDHGSGPSVVLCTHL